MKQEHLLHPEQAPAEALDAALTERAWLFFERSIAPQVENTEYLTNREVCAELGSYLDRLQSGWQRTINKSERQRLGELEYTKKSLRRAGQAGRDSKAAKLRGTDLNREQRQQKYGKAEGIRRNKRMTHLGAVRWYEDHQAVFDEFREKLAGHLDFLEGLEDITPFDPDYAKPGPELQYAA